MFTKREALALIERLRAEGKTVVFTNGVFDLLASGARALSSGTLAGWGTRSSSA